MKKKIIRDKYIDIINDKSRMSYEEDKEKLVSLFKEKLLEEVNEFIETDLTSLEELGDVLEVIEGIRHLQELDKEEVIKSKNEKKEKFGTFKTGLTLALEDNNSENNNNFEDIIKSKDEEIKRLKERLLIVEKNKKQEEYKKVECIVKELLPSIDSIDFALASTNIKIDFENSSSQELEKTFNNFSIGLNYIKDKLNISFENIGIDTINTKGILDPMVHEACKIEVDNNLEDNTILKVESNGYTFNNKVIRPARVIVSKKEKDNE